MKHLLLTGASGLLGVNLALRALEQGWQVTGWVNTRVLTTAPFECQPHNLTDFDAVETALNAGRWDAIIHAAAIANIDQAEKDPQQAQHINAELPGFLAAWAGRQGIPFVHISTDAVFDGERGNYVEDDAVNPLSVYARTKYAAEQAVTAANVQALIARVNFFGWSLSGSRSLSEFFFNNLQAGRAVNGFTDVLFCPLYVEHLADALLEMLEKRLQGLYHVLSAQPLSKYAFGVAIARQFGFDETLVHPVSVNDGGLAARRSPNLTLKNDKLVQALGHDLPTALDGIKAFHLRHVDGYANRIRAFM